MYRLSIPLFILWEKLKNWVYPILRFFLTTETLFIIWILMLIYQIHQDYPRWQTACITKVKDGDTLVFYLPQNPSKQFTARLWGIDAFELDQKPWGNISKKKLSQLLKFDENRSQEECQGVELKNIKRDLYQRELVFVKKSSIDKLTLNEKMIMSGWALYYINSDWLGSEKVAWKKIQDFAKLSKKGIWKYPKKFWLVPAKFRKNISIQLAHRKDFDQMSFEPEQKF